MVLFGAYHSAERFLDENRLTAHFPGPGSYPSKSVVEGAPSLRYASRIIEDGCPRLDGSSMLFRERDSWVRGVEGPKGLTSLAAGNPFVSPAIYSTEPGERFLRKATPAAFFNTLEDRYLSPSTRCLTPDHERAAKGTQSPGPGKYYPVYESREFAPPDNWDSVNKGCWTPRRGFNSKAAWGEAAMPRPPDPARAAQTPTKEERAWLLKRRGSLRPSTSPRCMWVTGVNTSGGLQAWGDIATKTGPIHVGHGHDCAPRALLPGRHRSAPERRGPVHSCEVRATSPGFREVRYYDRELTQRSAATAKGTPGPGEYNIRPSMPCGTTFAGPRPKSSRATTVAAAVAFAKIRSKFEGEHAAGLPEQSLAWPPRVRSERLPTPLMGRESPGPAYVLPSDFDMKHCNKKIFHPPPCKRRVKSRGGGGSERGGEVLACVRPTSSGVGVLRLCQERDGR